ncbi:putative acyl-CoA transferase/carnitine dehydratase [SAR116 cluster alpha proteobacterium HIMB100]|nr:putative acyl-CoA transferase/carnitine dehydratase [SAR116 cluster alpha proteobacterium HIMB100]
MLSGIRVLDLTNVLAGPFCCHQLAHMGAEVIKIEAVGRGDLARQLGADKQLSAAQMGISFLAQNAGKKSLTLDLKSDKGKEIFRKLVQGADVVVENFRPGVMARLGLNYPVLKKLNPQLIYCAISGFGQTGPLSPRPAYDQIIQGLSGVMSITGKPEEDPLRVGFPLADTIGGLTAAMAVSAALNKRPRGQMIDVSMLDSVLTTMGWVVSNYLIGGIQPAQHGNENTTSAPSGTFQTADGLLNIAANEERQWQALIKHIGCPHLADDDRFATRDNRKLHRQALSRALDSYLRQKSATEWERELTDIGIPAGVVMTVPEILAHPHTAHRGLLSQFDNIQAATGPVSVMRTGFQSDGQPASVDTPPPVLGAHNHELLKDLGYDESAIEQLSQEGVI